MGKGSFMPLAEWKGVWGGSTMPLSELKGWGQGTSNMLLGWNSHFLQTTEFKVKTGRKIKDSPSLNISAHKRNKNDTFVT